MKPFCSSELQFSYVKFRCYLISCELTVPGSCLSLSELIPPPPDFVLGVCSVSHTSFPLSPFALHVGFSSCVLSSGSVIYMDLPRKWTVFSLLCWFLRDRLDVVWTTSLSSYFLTLVCHTVE